MQRFKYCTASSKGNIKCQHCAAAVLHNISQGLNEKSLKERRYPSFGQYLNGSRQTISELTAASIDNVCSHVLSFFYPAQALSLTDWDLFKGCTVNTIHNPTL